MLGVNGSADSKGRVELFEKGYGKDAAAIAKEAISFGEFSGFFFVLAFLKHVLAKDTDFDVVLIDTAGRMQDNEVSCLLS